jgi:hypothetical protein
VVFGIGGSMKERPILFNGAMVRAILDGSKTQTRRLANTGHYAIDEEYHGIEVAMRERAAMIKNCPLGQVGDQLWVRETWRGIVQINGPHEQYQTGVARYVPDQEKCIRVEYLASHSKDSEPWRPNIHMPRWASRIQLEITGVRVERLQDISEKDATAEGWERRPEVSDDPEVHGDAARDWFSDLWESINGANSWDANPYVWALDFKRVAA